MYLIFYVSHILTSINIFFVQYVCTSHSLYSMSYIIAYVSIYKRDMCETCMCEELCIYQALGLRRFDFGRA